MTKRVLTPLLVLVCVLAVPAMADASRRDRDGDKLPDRWERRHHLSTKHKSARRDPDNDRLRNRAEFRHKTNPRRKDTDGDGLRDRAEIRRYKTNPRRKDTDGDGLRDRAEIRRYKTNPRRKDTDRDGYPDGVEIRAGSNPRDARSVPANQPPAPGGAPRRGPTAADPVGAPATPPTPPRCDLGASPGTLRQVLQAAQPGQEICLVSGDYGTLTGVQKAGKVRIREAPGASATIRLDFNGASFIEIDGLTIGSARLSGGTHDVSILDSTFTGSLTIIGLTNANVLLDHNTHANINAGGQSSSPARIHLSYSSTAHSGVTVQSSLLAGGDSDGIQTGVGVNIIANEFRDILENGPNHTDAIQVLGARGVLVRANYIHNSSTGIVAYDGISASLIEDNVIALPRRPWGIELYSDDGSVVRHNTLLSGSCDFNLRCGAISMGRKSSDDAGRGTAVIDNIATEINAESGSSLGARHHNLVQRGAVGGDLSGSPRFVGGAVPAGYAGYALAAGSPGVRAASDGANIGIR